MSDTRYIFKHHPDGSISERRTIQKMRMMQRDIYLKGHVNSITRYNETKTQLIMYHDGRLDTIQYMENEQLKKDIQYGTGTVQSVKIATGDETSIRFSYYPNGALHEMVYRTQYWIHRTGRPAVIGYFQDGRIRTIIYYHEGRAHREDGPAVIVYGGSHVKSIDYYRHGMLHRDGGPASIVFTESGRLSEQRYYTNGVQTRRVDYHLNGRVRISAEYENGARHSPIDGTTTYNADGSLESTAYWVHGRVMNPNGPACIDYFRHSVEYNTENTKNTGNTKLYLDLLSSVFRMFA